MDIKNLITEEDLEAQRDLFELEFFINSKNEELDSRYPKLTNDNKLHLQQNKGVYKRFYEELKPLYIFLKFIFPTYTARLVKENTELYDAIIKNFDDEIKIQITCAKDGKHEVDRAETLVTEGVAKIFKESYIKSEKIHEDTFCLLRKRITNKLIKSDPTIILIVYFDDHRNNKTLLDYIKINKADLLLKSDNKYRDIYLVSDHETIKL